MVQVLKKIWNRLFGRSRKNWEVQFRILNKAEITKLYNDDHASYLAECVWTHWPIGVISFYGKKKGMLFCAAYDAFMIQPEVIADFLFNEYGAQMEEIRRIPYKRFFGIEYL